MAEEETTQVTLGCVLSGYAQLKDRGFKITLETGELLPDQILGISEMYNKNAFMTLGANPVNFDDIKDDLPQALQQAPKKNPASKRLRSVLYRLWEQEGEQGEFDLYYEATMDKIIEHYKDKLED